ncbi:MAG TPA: hypothetical protein VGO50_00990 [Pyrinomonadaceae bacterium]|jgi:hypothetical protein|nr:hypothetical protein [Pyrinomonadaceae bacterium]
MADLEVSFNSPQCGWMSIGFTAGANEFHTTTAHAPHEHALTELLTVLADLLDRDKPAFTHVLRWNRDPEEFDFVFHKAGQNAKVEIVQYPTDEREAAEREIVFFYEGAINEIARAFHETFAQLYADRHTDEFEFNWRQPFPAVEFANFESKIEKMRIV